MESEQANNEKTANFFALFASSSTLICCALPALFTALGAGASLASLSSTFPFLITLSIYKLYITFFALVMLLIAGYVNYRNFNLPCPADPELGRLCMKTRRQSRNVFYVSTCIFLFATVFTYLVPNFL